MVYALQATHSGLVKFTGRGDPSYLKVCKVLKSIERRARDHIAAPPFATPKSQSHEASAEEPQRIKLKAYLHSINPASLETERRPTVSELQETSPFDILQSATTPGGARAPRPELIWAHIPLTNSAWVNVRVVPRKGHGPLIPLPRLLVLQDVKVAVLIQSSPVCRALSSLRIRTS